VQSATHIVEGNLRPPIPPLRSRIRPQRPASPARTPDQCHSAVQFPTRNPNAISQRMPAAGIHIATHHAGSRAPSLCALQTTPRHTLQGFPRIGSQTTATVGAPNRKTHLIAWNPLTADGPLQHEPTQLMHLMSSLNLLRLFSVFRLILHRPSSNGNKHERTLKGLRIAIPWKTTAKLKIFDGLTSEEVHSRGFQARYRRPVRLDVVLSNSSIES
jgi:hypothetical protein